MRPSGVPSNNPSQKPSSAPSAGATIDSLTLAFIGQGSQNFIDLQVVNDGDTIDLATLAYDKLSIRADTTPSMGLTVTFTESNTGGGSNTYTESSGPPYTLRGFVANGDRYIESTILTTVGTYTLDVSIAGGASTMIELTIV